jgi:hypothetical protein
MLDAGLDTMRRVEDPPGAGVRRLLLPGVAVEVFVERSFVADGVEITH